MLYRPEIFVYIMLLPAICLVIVPALLSTTRVVIGALKTKNAVETQETFDQEVLAEA